MSGSPTSWIQRGIRILAPEGIERPSYAAALAGLAHRRTPRLERGGRPALRCGRWSPPAAPQASPRACAGRGRSRGSRDAAGACACSAVVALRDLRSSSSWPRSARRRRRSRTRCRKGSCANPTARRCPRSWPCGARCGSSSRSPRAAVTAIGYHGTDGASCRSSRSAARRTRACCRGSCTGSSAAAGSGPTYYELGGGAGAGDGRARRRRAAGHRRLLAGRRDDRLDRHLRPEREDVRRTRSTSSRRTSASSVVVVTRLRADPSLTVGEPVLDRPSKIGTVHRPLRRRAAGAGEA